ncbi:hypothetical protein VPHK391_0094 [Vibrio phage K391]
MKAKTIQQDIESKINDWALSIEDEQLSKEVVKNAVVTGGCIASMFLQENVNDYDVYFTDVRTTFKVAVYYINKMNLGADIRLTLNNRDDVSGLPHTTPDNKNDEFWSDKLLVSPSNEFLTMSNSELDKYLSETSRVEVFISSAGVCGDLDQDADQHHEANDDEGDKYRPVFISSNAVTLSHKVQLVLRFIGTPAQIHESYDFAHATNYWTEDEGLVTNTEALEALLARELVYRGSKYPLASIFRTRKFIQRGWGLHIGNYVKMAIQLNEFDLTDVKVLEEQLTGVDSLYMHQVISAIKEQTDRDPSFEFTALYVCEICDRMMGADRHM